LCGATNSNIISSTAIPDWCPLPDRPLTQQCSGQKTIDAKEPISTPDRKACPKCGIAQLREHIVAPPHDDYEEYYIQCDNCGYCLPANFAEHSHTADTKGRATD